MKNTISHHDILKELQEIQTDMRLMLSDEFDTASRSGIKSDIEAWRDTLGILIGKMLPEGTNGHVPTEQK